jgi:hypothetical protein
MMNGMNSVLRQEVPKKKTIVSKERQPAESAPRDGFVRDTGPYSTRNLAKGASIGDAGCVFEALQNGLDVQQVREQALSGTLLPQRGRSSRERVWASLHHRYLTHGVAWIIEALTQSYARGAQSPEFVSLLYLHYALRDHLTYDFITDSLWHKGHRTRPVVIPNDVLDLLDREAEAQPQTQRWAEQSRRKLANSILTALRDFGVLEGVRKKVLVRPVLPPDTAEHLLRILITEGRRGRRVLEDETWRLFMLDKQDVTTVLGKLAQAGRIRFEKVGTTVVLETPDIWEADP